MTTSVPRLIMLWSVVACHLLREINFLRYSLYHRSQKCCLICWASCQQFSRLVAMFRNSPNGKLVMDLPIRKWPGVRGRKSFWSGYIGVRGRELSIAWISTTYSLFPKKRYEFSQKVSKIFIPFFYVLTVRLKGYGATTDSFQSCSKCQILHNIKLSTLNVTKRLFCATMHADHIFHTQLLPKCLKSLSTSCKSG